MPPILGQVTVSARTVHCQPGVVFLPFWQPDTLPNASEPGSMLMLCGVARKP
jgi:hypothetical protein